MPPVQGSACSDSDSVLGRKVREVGAGVGGRLCSGSPLTAHRVPPVSLRETDLPSPALSWSFLGVWYASACFLNEV